MNCNCECFNDNINIINHNYNNGSDSWTNSYLCDFMALREDSAADKEIDNPASVAQGLSILNDGKYAVVYLINEAATNTPEKTRTRLVLIDLQNFKILDSVERDTATDDTTRYLNHANGATAYTDENGVEHTVTAHGHYAFDTAIISGKISAVTQSIPLITRDTPTGVYVDYYGATSITLDKATGYWYIAGAGKVYRSAEPSFSAVPTNFDYIMTTGTNSDDGAIVSLRRQGCMVVNQSITVKDNILYATVSGPAMFVAFNVDTNSDTFGELIAVHNMDEYNTGYVGVENECLGWSDYLNSWVTVTNGRYADEYSTDGRSTGTSQMLFNHIVLWAVGSTVGNNFKQTYTQQDQTKFTIIAGLRRVIFCTLDADIMTVASGGHKIGEYIRHTGYKDTPFRSIGQALAMANALKQDTCHQTVCIAVNGDFAKYVRGSKSNNYRILLNTDFDIRLVNGSTFPACELLQNVSVSLIASNDNGTDTNSSYRASIPSVIVGRGSKLTALQIYISYLELRATSILTGNSFGSCQLMANGQNVISIGGTDNNFSGTVSASVVFINGGDSNLNYSACINLKNATEGASS